MKKIISINDIVLTIILFVILLLNPMSESFVNIITFSLLIGWLFPFIFPIIVGISILSSSHLKLSVILNLLTIILSSLLLFLIINIYDSNMKLILIFYIILSILNIINIIYLNIYFHNLYKEEKVMRKQEYMQIKKLKKENNGIIK